MSAKPMKVRHTVGPKKPESFVPTTIRMIRKEFARG